MTKIQIIIGSTREKRRSESVANWIYDLAREIEGIEFEIVDLRDYPLPFYQEPGSPRMLKDDIPVAKKWREKIQEADGYLIVSPEYNHGYSAVLKNALDYTYSSWNNKAVGFVSYGTVGGARAVEQLRLVAIELQMAPIQQSINLMKAHSLFDENGKMIDDSHDKIAHNFLEQLIWWTNALKEARSKTS